MTSILPSSVFRTLAPDATLNAAMVQELLERAHRLKTASRAGNVPVPVLQGKNLAVLWTSEHSGLSVLHEAAAELGVRVAQVSLGEPPPAPSEFARIGRMLGRMYDAIDVGTDAPAAAAELAVHAGVPVCRGLADGHHPALTLAWRVMRADAALQADGADDATDRRFLLQALLLATIG